MLIPTIRAVVHALGPPCTVLDLFSGTSRVGHALKRDGYQVFANDHNAYAATLATAYVQADDTWLPQATSLLAELDALPGRPGWFTETFCEKSRFFQPKNGARVDAIRDAIEQLDVEPELRAVLLVSLMEAADRVDSTTGVQMAYLKTWAPRAHNDLRLRVPDLLPRASAGASAAYALDASVAARTLTADVAYIDPPYNQHKYLGNYHIWESLVLWDKPAVYGVACKRVDCRERKSAFNGKRSARDALVDVIETVDARHLVVSFNDEGHVAPKEIEALLSARGHVTVHSIDFKRYVGAHPRFNDC